MNGGEAPNLIAWDAELNLDVTMGEVFPKGILFFLVAMELCLFALQRTSKGEGPHTLDQSNLLIHILLSNLVFYYWIECVGFVVFQFF